MSPLHAFNSKNFKISFKPSQSHNNYVYPKLILHIQSHPTSSSRSNDELFFASGLLRAPHSTSLYCRRLCRVSLRIFEHFRLDLIQFLFNWIEKCKGFEILEIWFKLKPFFLQYFWGTAFNSVALIWFLNITSLKCTGYFHRTRETIFKVLLQARIFGFNS